VQFWLKCVSVAVATALLGGCASPEDRVVNEDHQYVNTAERDALKLPPGAKTSVGDETYFLPQKKSAGAIGENLEINSPLQLLALAGGSRLDDVNKASKIWFDRTSVVKDLPTFTFGALSSYLKRNNVTGSTLDSVKRTAKTGWINEVREGSFWSWGDNSTSSGYRFSTSQYSSGKGNTTSVEVKLEGYQRDGEDVPMSTLSEEYIDRSEIAFLNDYIYHFQLLQEVLMKKAQIARASDFTLKMGNNEKGEHVFRSAKNVDVVWVEFRTLLEKIGFTVDDVDRTTKKLFLTYAKPDQGFWGSLWDDDDFVELDLPPGQYVIRVTELDRKSVITFYDQDEQPLPQNRYTAMENSFIKLAKKLELEL
jgi:outer membrane protein assembly factor BamC